MNKKIESKIIAEKSKKIVQACNGDACTICVKECLMLKEYMQSPKAFFRKFLVEESIDPKVPFSCTQCGYCESVCPKDLKIHEIFKEMRKALQLKSKFSPVLRSHYNVYLHQRLSQGKLIKGYSKGQFKRAFMPGCSLSAYSPTLVEKTYQYLKSIDPFIGSITSCCSKPLQDLGHENTFKNHMSKFADEMASKGVKEIIVGCLNCYDTLKSEHPALKIKTIWHIFDEEGLPKKNIDNELSLKTYVIHDPCPVEKSPEIKGIIRGLLSKLGCEVKNAVPSVAKCCGLGAMAAVSNEALAQRIAKQQMNALDGTRIINYCAACTEAMGQGNKESYHILELIFNDFVKSEKSTLKKWKNRYATKQRIT